MSRSAVLFKDEIMSELAKRGVNIASFVSFGPKEGQRFSRVRGIDPEIVFPDCRAAVRAMYMSRHINMVNVRTFLPDKPDGNPFFLGIKHGFKNADTAAACMESHLRQGYYVIVNENIDPNDGGFSGVAMGDCVEFAACDIPRCVDKEEEVPCAALSRSLTRRLVRKVYGYNLVFPFPTTWRVEFSVHPGPVGYFGEKMTVWQAEDQSDADYPVSPSPVWPNRFSTFVGDKAFGLLMADLHDFPVPYTKVFGRVVPPFEFGTHVHSGEGNWIRTCPREQQPGRFTTRRGYIDPFALMQNEDPGHHIASIIIQQGIKPGYSGAVITGTDKKATIEGKAGRGDSFMTGSAPPDKHLPADVYAAVKSLWWELTRTFGIVRFEWVYDTQRKQAWIIQLHGGDSPSVGRVIYPGQAVEWRDFIWKDNLEELRVFSSQAKFDGAGIRLIGNVAITSHPADILRRDRVPSNLCTS
jgi:hypothetical protein